MRPCTLSRGTLGRVALAILLSLSAFGASSLEAADPLRIVTTTPDLADLTRAIGGDEVTVKSLTRGTEDFHAVRPRPKLLIALSKADVLVQIGLDLEHSWLPALVQSARNKRIKPGTSGWITASAGIEPLEVPKHVHRKDGPDVHPKGNPHVNLSPVRAQKLASNILEGLCKAAPDRAEGFRARHAEWERGWEKKLADWKSRLAPLRGAALIEFHQSWSYLADDFGLRIVARLEPKPGVSPSARYLAEVVETGKKEKVGAILARPANADIANKVAKEIGATPLILPLASTTKGEFEGYETFFEQVVTRLETNLKK